MPFIVEDGTGLVDANSYGSVEEADAYFGEVGNTTWTGTNTAKQNALVMGTRYIELRFRNRFKGVPLYPENPQALSFPRNIFDGIVKELKYACFEYALRVLTGSNLAPDPVSTPGKQIKREKKKVGPIEKEFEYSNTSPTNLFQPYPAADQWLSGLIVTGRKVVR